MDYVLTTEGLCKQYGKSRALNGLSMHVPRGAIYGLVGKNGSGKTTLIRLVCGLQSPTAGSFTLYGVGNGDRALTGARRRMGAVVDLAPLWCFSIPLTALLALVLDAPVALVCLAPQVEHLSKCPIGLLRVRSRKWINDVTIKEET